MDFSVLPDGAVMLGGSLLTGAVVVDEEVSDGEMRLDIEHRDGVTGDDAVFDGFEPWRVRLDIRIFEPAGAPGSSRRDQAAKLRSAAREMDAQGLPVRHVVAGGPFAVAGVDRALLIGLRISRLSGRDALTASTTWLERDPTDGIRQKQAAENQGGGDDANESDEITDAATNQVDAYLSRDA